MKVAVMGAGAWGTALANMLARKGLATSILARNGELAHEMNRNGENVSYLPGVKLSTKLIAGSDPRKILEGADCFVIAVPSQFIRPSLESVGNLLPDRPVMVCASKGIELSTLSPMSRVVAEALEGKKPRYAMLSGPSFAFEVGREMPTSVSLGCTDGELAEELQDIFSTQTFRVYTTPDFKGVELGGAVKNVVAIAAGIADGLGFGHNSRAAIITRGLAEMSRLGREMGAERETFMGLSGMGDLVLTCTGDLSRNRQVGLKVGQGVSLEEIVNGSKTVAEGVKTAKALYRLSVELNVDLPITEQVYNILYKGKDPAEAVKDLMGRRLKNELYD